MRPFRLLFTPTAALQNLPALRFLESGSRKVKCPSQTGNSPSEGQLSTMSTLSSSSSSTSSSSTILQTLVISIWEDGRSSSMQMRPRAAMHIDSSEVFTLYINPER
ncbi:hypothetical protein CgunFtcFv8_027896 [Champsocephalus gunnari]|uniref:Uncharacterized protein n=1 Tax=Champsocephalus gunnari TaxID=52237 RepID=A0AAN8E7D6_CHAGU|nr:hypothetical protein CgunFtcFv8_027896 [Champsocephalus gunnari]